MKLDPEIENRFELSITLKKTVRIIGFVLIYYY